MSQFSGLGGTKQGSAANIGPHITLTNGNTIGRWGAERFCEEQVTEILRAPSTAKFPNINSPRLRGNTWEYIVVVDAQNGFGAMIRESYRCVLNGNTNGHSLTPVN